MPLLRAAKGKRYPVKERKVGCAMTYGVCSTCGKIRPGLKGCSEVFAFMIDPENNCTYKRIRVGDPGDFFESKPGASCMDCGAKPGRLHHWNCMFEVCPKCGKPLESCSCNLEMLFGRLGGRYGR